MKNQKEEKDIPKLVKLNPVTLKSNRYFGDIQELGKEMKF